MRCNCLYDSIKLTKLERIYVIEKNSVFNTLFLLIITSVTVSPAKVKAKSEDYTDDYVFGEKDFFSASDTANDKDMTFTATEDGLYSVRIKI